MKIIIAYECSTCIYFIGFYAFQSVFDYYLYSSHQVQPCTKKMKKSEENFYLEKKEKVFF